LTNNKSPKTQYKAQLKIIIAKTESELLHKFIKGSAIQTIGDTLRKLVQPISDPDLLTYLDESIRCAETNCVRASVVLAWCAVAHVIHKKLTSLGLAARSDVAADPFFGRGGRMLAAKELPRRLTVFEIDPERVGFLKQAAGAVGFAIEIVPHDLRDPLAPEFAGAFDSFETDPPYTIAGATLFVRRGVEALDHGRGYGMLSFGHTSPPDRIKLQQALTSLGVGTTALYPAFNAYTGASILGSTSELHELIATGKTAPVEKWQGALYTAEVNPRVRLYACTQCKRRFSLGTDAIPPTIEALKAAGYDRGWP